MPGGTTVCVSSAQTVELIEASECVLSSQSHKNRVGIVSSTLKEPPVRAGSFYRPDLSVCKSQTIAEKSSDLSRP